MRFGLSCNLGLNLLGLLQTLYPVISVVTRDNLCLECSSALPLATCSLCCNFGRVDRTNLTLRSFSSVAALSSSLQNAHPNPVPLRYADSGMHGSKYVSVVVSGAEDNTIVPNAYQASTQAMALVRGALADSLSLSSREPFPLSLFLFYHLHLTISLSLLAIYFLSVVIRSSISPSLSIAIPSLFLAIWISVSPSLHLTIVDRFLVAVAIARSLARALSLCLPRCFLWRSCDPSPSCSC